MVRAWPWYPLCLVHGFDEEDALLQTLGANSLLRFNSSDLSSSCTPDMEKDIAASYGAKATQLTIEKFIETGMAAAWSGAGPAGAVGGALFGDFLAEALGFYDPNDARFEALEASVTCLEAKVDKNTKNIGQLQSAVASNTAMINEVRGILGTALNLEQPIINALNGIQAISMRASFCSKCLKHLKQGGPNPGYRYGTRCTVHSESLCNIGTFRMYIDQSKSLPILNDLYDAVRIIKRVWESGLPNAWNRASCDTGNSKYITGLMEGLPKFFTAAVSTRAQVMIWMNILLGTTHSNDGAAIGDLESRVTSFYTHLLIQPFGVRSNNYHGYQGRVSYAHWPFRPGTSFWTIEEMLLWRNNNVKDGRGTCECGSHDFPRFVQTYHPPRRRRYHYYDPNPYGSGYALVQGKQKDLIWEPNPKIGDYWGSMTDPKLLASHCSKRIQDSFDALLEIRRTIPKTLPAKYSGSTPAPWIHDGLPGGQGSDFIQKPNAHTDEEEARSGDDLADDAELPPDWVEAAILDSNGDIAEWVGEKLLRADEGDLADWARARMLRNGKEDLGTEDKDTAEKITEKP